MYPELREGIEISNDENSTNSAVASIKGNKEETPLNLAMRFVVMEAGPNNRREYNANLEILKQLSIENKELVCQCAELLDEIQTDCAEKSIFNLGAIVEAAKSQHLNQDDSLANFKGELIKAKFEIISEKLQALRFGENDVKMNEYLENQKQTLDASPGDAEMVFVDMQGKIKLLEANGTSIDWIRKKIQSFNSGYYWGGKAKATEIEQAIGGLDLEKRVKLNSINMDEIEDLTNALATNRLTRKKKDDVTTFKDFKKQFRKESESPENKPINSKTNRNPEP